MPVTLTTRPFSLYINDASHFIYLTINIIYVVFELGLLKLMHFLIVCYITVVLQTSIHRFSYLYMYLLQFKMTVLLQSVVKRLLKVYSNNSSVLFSN